MTPWIFLCISALLGGMVNSIAGGGTLLTFPALLWALAGLPNGSVIANATSTVALFPGSVASAWGYRQELARVKGWLLLLLAPSFIGSVVGTFLVAKRDPDEFKALVPWLILGATVLFILQPVLGKLVSKKKEAKNALSWRGKALVVLFQFAIALYGGYFGAGIGILMLSALSVLGISDIHDLNALKTSLASAINFISVAVFIGFGLVNWQLAVPMIVAAIIGGYAGARIARRLNRNWVRFIVIGIGLTVSVFYLWQSAM